MIVEEVLSVYGGIQRCFGVLHTSCQRLTAEALESGRQDEMSRES